MSSQVKLNFQNIWNIILGTPEKRLQYFNCCHNNVNIQIEINYSKPEKS